MGSQFTKLLEYSMLNKTAVELVSAKVAFACPRPMTLLFG